VVGPLPGEICDGGAEMAAAEDASGRTVVEQQSWDEDREFRGSTSWDTWAFHGLGGLFPISLVRD
jgi:hypothetical protein